MNVLDCKVCYRLKLHQEDAKDNTDTERLDFFVSLTKDHQAAQHGSVQLGMFNPGAIFDEFSLFNNTPKTGEEEMESAKASREQGMAKAERGIDPHFRRIAPERLWLIAKAQPFLTSDDIWAKMPKPYDLAHYREARHMSDIVKWGVRERYIKRNDRYVPSKSPKANMVLHNQWRSLIYVNPDPHVGPDARYHTTPWKES